MIFDASFNYLINDENFHNYHVIFKKQIFMIFIINFMSSISRFLNQNWMKKFWTSSTKNVKNVNKFMNMIKFIVKKRIQSIKQNDDMFDSFFNHEMSSHQIETKILIQFSINIDFNFIVFRNIFLHLIICNEIYLRFQTKINQKIANDMIFNFIIALKTMTFFYFDVVIRENMRIWSFFVELNIKKMNSKNEIIKNQFIFDEIDIDVSFWNIQRNFVFEKNVNIFKFERWVEVNVEKKNHEKNAWFNFRTWLIFVFEQEYDQYEDQTNYRENEIKFQHFWLHRTLLINVF